MPAATSVAAPGGEPSRSALWLERGATWLGAVALFALTWRYMDLLGDSFWSIATGRYILEHGSLPKTDPFSFTASGPFYVHMPLGQLIFGFVADTAGLVALELFGTVVVWLGLLLLLLPHAKAGFARLVPFCLLALSIFVQADDLCVRGQVFGDLAFAALLVCLFRLRDGRRVHAVVPVLLASLWINLHSSAFLGVALPLAFAVASRFERAASRTGLRSYLSFAGLSALGLFLNPYGVHLILDLLRLLTSASTRHIDLFQPPDFASPLTLVALAVPAVTAFACFRRPNAAGGIAEAVLLALWLVAAATGRRYLPLALGFSVVVIARRADAVEARSGSASIGQALDFALCLAATAAAFFGLGSDKDPFRDVPFEEARIVEQFGLPDRVANVYHWGGYLDYAWNGRRKTFVDGRNQLFEHGAFEAEAQLERAADWARILDAYRINTVLWERNGPLDVALSTSESWALVRRGRIAVLYVRRNPL
jgi:hypothetical protein